MTNRRAREALLPQALIDKRVLSPGGESSWPCVLIPTLIEAVRSAGLVNRGGTLQFNWTDHLCECMNMGVWVSDKMLTAGTAEGRVDQAAAMALSLYSDLGGMAAFLEDGVAGFGRHLQPLIERGIDLQDIAYFTWYFD